MDGRENLYPLRTDAKMHTVELLEQAIALAGQCGIGVRQDWFGGATAGACEFQGRRWIFIDLALSPREQLDQVLDALRDSPQLQTIELPPRLHAVLKLPKAA